MKDKLKTIGIGSLPHLDVRDAIIYSFKHDIPFLPQMTSLGERMVNQVLSNDLEKSYLALNLFKEEIIKNKCTEFKIQIVGPTSSGLKSKTILSHVYHLLNFFSRDLHIRPIVFIDEPNLEFESNELKNVLSELSLTKIKTGIHCCNKFDYKNFIDHLENLNISFISFDQNLITNYVRNETILEVIGITPFEKIKTEFSASLISSNCGLMKYSEKDCELILEHLNRQK